MKPALIVTSDCVSMFEKEDVELCGLEIRVLIGTAPVPYGTREILIEMACCTLVVMANDTTKHRASSEASPQHR